MTPEVSAVEYHERTKHAPESIRTGPGLDFDNEPSPYKTYTDLPSEPLPDDPPGPEIPALYAVAVDRPDPDGLAAVDDPDVEGVDRETVAQLCHYAAGVTKEIERGDRTVEFRAAATTGALYHVDLYLVAGDVDGLDDGVYHFDPRSNSLDVLREGDFRRVLAAASERDRVARAPVTVVATSTWWRNAWKYRERTFRHAFWDSGTTLANLLAVAHARGLSAETVLGFADDPVCELLGVDPTDEAPLELVPIGAGDPAPEPPDVGPIDPETEPLSSNPQTFPLIHRAWCGGVLGDGSAAAEWRRNVGATAPLGTRPGGDGERVPLAPVDRETATARPLGNTIVRRGSCRAYERDPISYRKFSTVLDRAIRGVPMDVRDSGGSPLQFSEPYLIVAAVDGLDPGVYRFHADAGELEAIRSGRFREQAGHLALDQRLAADAAVCLYFLTDVEAVTEAAGNRGYRVAQFEAASTAGRLYLATYAHRTLGGTGLTFYDDAVTEFLSPHADGRTPTFLYTLGRPA